MLWAWLWKEARRSLKLPQTMMQLKAFKLPSSISNWDLPISGWKGASSSSNWTLLTFISTFRQLLQSKEESDNNRATFITTFGEKLDLISTWIENMAVMFLRKNRAFGSDLDSTQNFLDSHTEMGNLVHMKSFELEGLKGALKSMEPQCQSKELDKVNQLVFFNSKFHHYIWNFQVKGKINAEQIRVQQLMTRINKRIEIVTKVVKFLRLHSQLQTEFGTVERNPKSHSTESKLLIQQLTLQVCDDWFQIFIVSWMTPVELNLLDSNVVSTCLGRC